MGFRNDNSPDARRLIPSPGAARPCPLSSFLSTASN